MDIQETNALALKFRASNSESERDEIFERLVKQFDKMIYRYMPEMARYRGTEDDCRQEMLLQMYVYLNEKWDPSRASFITGLHWAFRKGIRDYKFSSNLIKLHFGIPKDQWPEFTFTSIEADRPDTEGELKHLSDSLQTSKFSWPAWEELQDTMMAFDKLKKSEKDAIIRQMEGSYDRTNKEAETARDHLRAILKREEKGKILYGCSNIKPIKRRSRAAVNFGNQSEYS